MEGREGIIVAHSTVADGSMLNRKNAGDEQVIRNRKNWLNSVGVPIENTYRICLTYEGNDDFCRYREVTPEDIPANTSDYTNEDADALVTTEPGVGLLLPIADCIGAVLYDEKQRVLMMSHLGRHSLEQNGGVRSVEHLVKNYGTNPDDVRVWLSAAVGKENYKIFALENKGMKEVAYEQLAAAGLHRKFIYDTDHDTDSHPKYYSHSEFLKGNKPENGRHAIVAMMVD